MIGAIVGEHTYNVDAYDRLQSYYVKAAAYAGDSFRFGYEGEDVRPLRRCGRNLPCAVARRVPMRCGAAAKMSGTANSAAIRLAERPIRTIASAPSSSSPSFAGQTFGLGQINPLTALDVDRHGVARLRL